jgi:dolichyl-phosphate beta-glucosyltransferase
MELSVIIPVYNEEKIIKSSLAKIIDFLERKKWIYEIIVVDDGSQDNTLSLLQNLTNPKIKIIKHQKNQGKGASVKDGVLAARYSYILFTDADLSTPIFELEKFLPFFSQYDILIASRALKNSRIIKKQPQLRMILGRLGNLFIRLILGLKIKDTQCGFKLFRAKIKKIFTQLRIAKWGFDFELLFLAQKNKMTIKEIPVIWYNNPETKVGFKDYFQTLIDVVKVRLNWLLGRYNR